MAWSISPSARPASLRAAAKASRASGTYISSPKRSSQTCASDSPGTRQRSRNSSLAAPRPTSSATAPSGAHSRRRRPVAAVALLGRAGQAGPEIRHDRQRRATCGGDRRRPVPARPRRSATSRRSHRRRRPVRGPMPRAPVVRARLVEIRRVGRGREEVLYRSGAGADGQGTPARFDAERGGVLVVRGHGPGPPATPTAEDARDGAPLKAPVGHVGPPGCNAAGHGLIIPETGNASHIWSGQPPARPHRSRRPHSPGRLAAVCLDSHRC